MSATIGEKAIEFDRLVQLLENELKVAQETIDRSPLLQAAGKAAEAHITRNTNYLKGLGLSSSERHDRIRYEAISRGVDELDLLYEHTLESVTYWPLQLSQFVYMAHDEVRQFGSDGMLWPVVVAMLPQDQIENIIQSLRLLCCPANGGIPAE